MSNNPYPVDRLIPYDLEVYPNFFLFGAKLPNGDYIQHGDNDVEGLRRTLNWIDANGYTLCGFNSYGYDDPVLTAFLEDPRTQVAYQRSMDIIENGMKPWDFYVSIHSVDLMAVLPGRQGLKKLGVCMGWKKLQELPFNPHKALSADEKKIITQYNRNDLDITELLLQRLMPELELRSRLSATYGIDLRSRGEAQIAEQVLLSESGLNKKDLREVALHNIANDPRIHITPPSWWDAMVEKREQYPSLQTVVDQGERLFSATLRMHGTKLPQGMLDAIVYLGDRYYKMGVGGLHSVDGAGCWKPLPWERMSDWDITSFYPSMILHEGLRPKPWGDSFFNIYKRFYIQRIAAKKKVQELKNEIESLESMLDRCDEV